MTRRDSKPKPSAPAGPALFKYEDQSWLRARVSVFTAHVDVVDVEHPLLAGFRPDHRRSAQDQSLGTDGHVPGLVRQLVHRILAPSGRPSIMTDALVNDSGLARHRGARRASDTRRPTARSTLLYLLGSRYCETDQLSPDRLAVLRQRADRLGAGPGDLRLRAPPPDFGYHLRATHANCIRRLRERTGVCRDYATWPLPSAAA